MVRRTPLGVWAAPALALALSSVAFAITVGPQRLPEHTTTATEQGAPMRLAETLTIGANVTLGRAEVEAAAKLAELKAWNDADKQPMRASIHRSLARPLEVRITPDLWNDATARDYAGGYLARGPQGSLVWGTAIQVEGAHTLRVPIEKTHLPNGTRLWAYPLGGAGRSFDTKYMTSKGTIWSPMVHSDRLYLEVVIPAGARDGNWSFQINRVSQMVAGLPQWDGAVVPEASPEDCLRFGSCTTDVTFPAIDLVSDGVFQYFYDTDGDGFGFTCSAGLLNDKDTHSQLLLGLTANHCISLPDDAAAVQPSYKYRFVGCPFTDVESSDGPVGATVLVTEALPGPDVTLLLMDDFNPPGGLALLGWTTARPGNNDKLHRLSHPVARIPGSSDPNQYILPQMYSRQHIDTTPTFDCSPDVPQSNFLYSVGESGTTVGGSSGSPVTTPDGFVVGQLLGSCSVPADKDDCDYATFNILDGAFESSFPFLAPFINTEGTACIPSSTTACHLDGRFQVRVDFSTTGPAAGGPVSSDAFSPETSGAAQVMSFNGERASSDQSSFWFFFDNANFEMGVKMVDACTPPFNAYWVFVSGLTNQAFDVTITDMVNHNVRHYTNPLGHYPQTVGATGTGDGFPCN
jgi:hypothetical protein